jgi:carboxyl-terminal processing protease
MRVLALIRARVRLAGHGRPARFLGGLVAIGIIASLTSAPIAVAQTDSAKGPIRERSLYQDLQLFSGVLNQIRVNHPDTTITTHQLIMAAIEGMVHAADPYSEVFAGSRLSPETVRAFRDGKMYPVPVDFAFLEGAPVVTSIAPGSEAARQDILPGDELIAFDGKPIVAQSADELEITLAGAKKSTAKLTFNRRRADGSLVDFTRDVKRERSDDESAVPTAFMLDGQTGYVRVASFDNQRVADDLHDALGRLEKQGMQRLVLDIRDNGGGYVNEAARIAGEFLPKGDIVYTVESRKQDIARDTGRVSRSFWSHEKRYSMIVLINAGSASASELMAGALQDHDRALIVGQPSHGKALEMLFLPIDDGVGSAVYINVGRVRTPCGRIVQREYHGIRRADYFRRAFTERDTIGRPSCKTDHGRVVYGGGGIYPDVRLPRPRLAPLWLSQVREANLPIKWTAGHVTANAAAYASLDALAAKPDLAAGGLADFRRFANEQGVAIPSGDEADSLLIRELVPEVAYVKWGTPGYYRIDAVLDPEVKSSLGAFDQAAAMLK